MSLVIKSVGTMPKMGRGGISTALVGYSESESLGEGKVEYLSSHSAESRIRPFISVVIDIFRDRNRDVLYWFHCARWLSLIRKSIFALFGKFFGQKVVFHFHSIAILGYMDSRIGRLLIWLMLLTADRVVVVSPWWRLQFVHRFPRYQGKIAVSPNPADRRLVHAASSPRIRSSRSTVEILAMSRLVKGKGFSAAIRSLCYLPDNFHLSIAGIGPHRECLSVLVSELELDHRVSFLGWVDYSDKDALFQRFDLFCLPSRYDSFGMVYLEAMAYGLPVIALDFQAIPEVVPDRIVGVLCADGHPQLIADAIVECSEKTLVFGGAGKRHVLDNFHYQKVSSDLYKTLSEA